MKNKKILQTGFTLLEVVIALAIMASIMIVLTSSWRGNFRRVKSAEIKTQAVHLLQQKMTEIEVLYAGEVRNMPKDLQKGKFEGEGLSKYTWEWQAADFKMPDIARLFNQQEGLVDETSLQVIKQMRTYLEESIKEVKVTLIYTASPKTKPQRFSIATIMVDYDTPINFGFGGGVSR